MSEQVLDIHPAEIDALCAALQEMKSMPLLRRVIVGRLGNGFTSDHVIQGIFGRPGEQTTRTVTRIISRDGKTLASYETGP